MASASSSRCNYKPLKVLNKNQTGDTLTINFDLENSLDEYTSHESEVFDINGKIYFEFRVMSVTVTNSDTFAENVKYSNTFYVRASNVDEQNVYTSYILSSDVLENDNRILDVGNDSTWRLISLWRARRSNLCIDVKVSVQDHSLQQPRASSILAALHEDDILKDFELCGEDGAVRVHKAVVAAASPVLRAMLEGQWRESQQGSVQVTGTTRATLLHLRDHLYLNVLPEGGHDLEQLLLIANYYQITNLRQRCLRKLVSSITSENLLALTEFAVKHGITDLHFMILESVQKGNIELEKIRQMMKIVL